MSNSQEHEEVSVSSGGVTVVKRFEADEFPVPAIAFEFSSDRDGAVAVTLSDEVPDGVAVEDLGFHPEYGSEHWTIDEDEIRFEYELEPDDEYTTVYGNPTTTSSGTSSPATGRSRVSTTSRNRTPKKAKPTSTRST